MENFSYFCNRLARIRAGLRKNSRTTNAMVRFIGTYTAKIDDKGRLVLPSAFKNAIAGGARDAGQAAPDMRLIVRKHIYEPALEVFTYEDWDGMCSEIRSALNPLNREHDKIRRSFFSCSEIIPDGKLGRITIPREYLEYIGAEKEVDFVGVDNKIEIWAKGKEFSAMLSGDEFAALAEKIPY